MSMTPTTEEAKTKGQEPKGAWMQTFCLPHFRVLDPDPSQILVEDIAHHLSQNVRYGGAGIRFLSVAEHSVHMARAASPEHALWALLHDASETYLHDLVRPVKRSLAGYAHAEDRIMRAVCERFGLPPKMPAAVKRLDNRILIDETRQNMRPSDVVWSFGGETEPLGITLQFWTPEQAEREFLATFAAITGQTVTLPAPAAPRADSAERTAGEVRTILACLWCQAEGNDPDDTISDAGHTVLDGTLGGLDKKAFVAIIGAERAILKAVTPPGGPRYQYREIGEGGDWRDCSRESYLAFARDPHIDTREVAPAPSSPGVPDSVRAPSEAAIEAAAATYYDEMIGKWPHTLGWAGKPEAFKAKVRDRMALALAAALSAHPAGQSTEDVQSPKDISGGLDGNWYCELHPEKVFGHDGCCGAGITSDQRIFVLVNQRRLAEQSVRECHYTYRDLIRPAGQSTGQGAEVGGSVEVIERCVKLATDAGLDSVTITGSVRHWQDIIAKLRKPAPDSTRTGQVETDRETIAREIFTAWFLAQTAIHDGIDEEAAVAWKAGTDYPDEFDLAYAAADRILAARPAAPEAQGADIEDRLSEILTASQVQDLSNRLLGAYMAPHGGLRLDNAEIAYLWTKLGGAL